METYGSISAPLPDRQTSRRGLAVKVASALALVAGVCAVVMYVSSGSVGTEAVKSAVNPVYTDCMCTNDCSKTQKATPYTNGWQDLSAKISTCEVANDKCVGIDGKKPFKEGAKWFTPCGEIHGTNACLGQPCKNKGWCLDGVNTYTCVCPFGYEGSDCELQINECSGKDLDGDGKLEFPCDKVAECSDGPGYYKCTCPSGYKGNGFKKLKSGEDAKKKIPGGNPPFLKPATATGCEDIDDCLAKPCFHDATCRNEGPNLFNCTCPTGKWAYKDKDNNAKTKYELWRGKRCEVDVDECEAGLHNCVSKEHCRNTKGSFVCNCPSGWKGDGMDPKADSTLWQAGAKKTYEGCVDLDDCASKPCKNGATCKDKGDGSGEYVCQCGKGHLGANCHLDYNECKDPKFNDNCDKLAVCTNTFGSYECKCKPGWAGNGTVGLCKDANDCKPNPCLNDGKCTDAGTLKFKCECKSGWGSKKCDGDWNECTLGIHKCHDHATCTNTQGSYTCKCDVGYSGDGVTKCENVDNCKIWEDDASVTDDPKEPWKDDKYIEVTVDSKKVTVTPCGLYDKNAKTFKEKGTCVDKENGVYQCKCKGGYTGTKCQTNVNECSKNSHSCSVNAKCIDTDGSYTCDCNHGFSGNGLSCKDIDDCVRGIYMMNKTVALKTNPERSNRKLHRCKDHNTAKCVDEGPFDFECQCKKGWTDKLCDRDVNECVRGTHECSPLADCKNTVGSHTCTCRKGAKGDGKKCVDQNDCADAPCVHGECKDVGVNSYRCKCDKGWTDRNCDFDINECFLNLHDCHKDARCVNTDNGYTCRCLSGWKGDGKTCTDINDCSPDPCNHKQHISCHDAGQNKFVCRCKNGFCGEKCDDDCNECLIAQNPCDKDATCTNTFGAHVCKCRDKFYGDGSSCMPCTNCHDEKGAGYVPDPKTPCGKKDHACIDRDECTLGIDNCDAQSKCINTEGSYTCVCKADVENKQLYYGPGSQDNCFKCTKCAQGEWMKTDCSTRKDRDCRVHLGDGYYAIETQAGHQKTQCLFKPKDPTRFYPERYSWGGDQSDGSCAKGGDPICGACAWEHGTAAQNVIKGMSASWYLARLYGDKYLILNGADGLGWRCLGFRPSHTAEAEEYPRTMVWKEKFIGDAKVHMNVGYWDMDEIGVKSPKDLYDKNGRLKYFCGFQDVDGKDAKTLLLENGAAVWRIAPLGCKGKYCEKRQSDRFVMMSGVHKDTDSSGIREDGDFECIYFRGGTSTHPSRVPRSSNGIFGHGNQDGTAAKDCGILPFSGQTQEQSLLQDKSAVFRLVSLQKSPWSRSSWKH